MARKLDNCNICGVAPFTRVVRDDTVMIWCPNCNRSELRLSVVDAKGEDALEKAVRRWNIQNKNVKKYLEKKGWTKTK